MRNVKQQYQTRAGRAGRTALAAGGGLVAAVWFLATGGCEMNPWPWASDQAPVRRPLTPLQDVEEFRREVLLARGPVLVDFYKDSCPTCVIQDGVLEGLAGEYEGRVKFVKFKIREATMMSTHPGFMEEQKLFWVPTTILYVDGREQVRWTFNHAAWEFRPALTAAARRDSDSMAVIARSSAHAAPVSADANGCTADGCPITLPPRLVEGPPKSSGAGPAPAGAPADHPLRLVP